MLILVVYYVIIAFLINMNVIADPASVPTKNGSSSIIVVINACSQDPPCFVSCIISFGDVKLYRSAILDYADNSYFPYANTTNGLHVTIFKHINVQDPGTVIITKKLGDGNHCFAVSGKYLTPEISNCYESNNGTIDLITRNLSVRNNATACGTEELFIVFLQFRSELGVTSSHYIYPLDDVELPFLIVPVESSFFTLYKKKWKNSSTVEIIKKETVLRSNDVCIEIHGNYEKPLVQYTICETLSESPLVNAATNSV